jgi:hypothetical protein
VNLTRRLFLQWSAAASAILAAVRRAPAQGRPTPALPGALDQAHLLPLAQAVLPGELGPAMMERAAGEFARWIAGFRAGEETLHPYGSERLGATGASPVAAWTAQLAALEAAAQAKHTRAFRDVAVSDRRALVEAALATVQVGARPPAVAAAPHVAIGLLAHFLESKDAPNLAYGRVIDAKQCRPLADSPKMPVPLRRAARGGQA